MRVNNSIKVILRLVCLKTLSLFLLASCQPLQTISPTQPQFSPTPISAITQLPTQASSPTSTRALPTFSPLPTITPIPPTPEISCQLTYISDCRTGTYNCLYGLAVGCWDSERLCLGEPQLLFQIPQGGLGPRYPILSHDWSPDGQKILIDATGEGGGQGDIFLGDWAGQNWINLTHSPWPEGYPTWSPDGKFITYVGKSGEPDDDIIRVYHIEVNGDSVIESITNSGITSKLWPSWSPDGKRIVFLSADKDGYEQVFTAKPDGSELQQLTDLPLNRHSPRFSPDGEWILFSRQIEQYSNFTNIYLIRPDGTDEMAVTHDVNVNQFDAAWSPFGDWIAFTSNAEGNWHIYLIRSDGTGIMRVTTSDVSEISPRWRKVLP